VNLGFLETDGERGGLSEVLVSDMSIFIPSTMITGEPSSGVGG
jgi:hypothetical protein